MTVKLNESYYLRLGAAALAAGLAWLAVTQLNPLRQAESWLGDVAFAYLARPLPQSSDIVILAINEDSLAELAFRSPISRRFLADLIEELMRRNVRAVGVDVLFDQATIDPEDRALLAAMESFPGPLVVAYAAPGSGLTQRQHEFQDRYLEHRLLGSIGVLVTDGVVRDLYVSEGSLDTFPVAMAKALGTDVPVDTQALYFRARAAGGLPPIRKYPAHQLGLLPARWFDNAIVLIGADLPNQDRFRTPLSVLGGEFLTMAGVELHAQALAQILEGRTYPTTAAWAFIAILAASVVFGTLLPLTPWHLGFKALAAIALLLGYWSVSLYGVSRGLAQLPILMPALGMLLSASFSSAYERRQATAQKRALRNAFQHYVSPSVIEEVVNDPDKLVLGGEEREMSFVFSDLGGFTALTERLSPKVTVALLQDYFQGMLQIALDLGGTVDRMVGDSVLVFFGAPALQADHARRAVICALRWDEYCEGFRREQQALGVPVGITRIGVHTGVAVVGNVGSRERFQYTAHGDCVNTAARLETANKQLGTRACLSVEAARHYPEGGFRPVGHLVVKGKTRGLDCVTVDDGMTPADIEEYRAAYTMMQDKDPRCVQRFAELFEKMPHDALVAFHTSRLERGEAGSIIVLEEK